MKLLLPSLLVIIAVGCTSRSSEIREMDSPAGQQSSLPRLYTDNTGTVYMSWVEEKGSLARLKYAKLQNDVWSSPFNIAADSTWFLNWADYPSIIARDDTPMAAHWLNRSSDNTYAYDINISTNRNTVWQPAFNPHKDHTYTEHGFVSMKPNTDSTFLAVWLDGRKTHDRGANEYSDLNKAMTLRGAIINRNAEILSKYLIDDSVCDCCNTALARTEKGFVVAYRNRTDNEVRDIYTSSLIDGKWSLPKAVHNDNWKIAACPVNGPAIDALDNNVALAWFTGANDTAKVKLSISNDFGNTFSKPIILSEEQVIGRVDLEINADKIWINWISADNDKAKLNIASYSITGHPVETYAIQDISHKRQTGFPQISAYKKGLIIVYTNFSDENHTLRILKLK